VAELLQLHIKARALLWLLQTVARLAQPLISTSHRPPSIYLLIPPSAVSSASPGCGTTKSISHSPLHSFQSINLTVSLLFAFDPLFPVGSARRLWRVLPFLVSFCKPTRHEKGWNEVIPLFKFFLYPFLYLRYPSSSLLSLSLQYLLLVMYVYAVFTLFLRLCSASRPLAICSFQ